MYFIAASVAAAQVLNHYNRLPFNYYATAISIYATIAFCYYFIWTVVLYPNIFSPLRKVPGPRGHWFYGQFREIFREEIGVPHLRWVKEHPGAAFIRYTGLFGKERLLVVSQAAHQYILTNCYNYPKPPDITRALKIILGAKGILFAEGDIHRRQRKQMNPSFAYGNLKSMVSIFNEKAEGLVHAWTEMIARSPTSEVEVLNGLSAATLDIIGAAGFGYEFHSVEGLTDSSIESPLAVAYADITDTKKQSKVLGAATIYMPWIRTIPFKRHREVDADSEVIKRISTSIVKDKNTKLRNGEEIGDDILSLLIKDNVRKEKSGDPNDPPMTDEEVSDQTMTLLAAGHETTSAGTTWAMHILSTHPDVQQKLRKELLDSGITQDPTFEKIESLHYLNNFVKEILRFYPPVPITRRTAQVSATIDGTYVPAGTDLFICTISTNKNPEIWGPTADQFDPERWDNLPRTHNNYGMQTFLHGSRSCIGQRFAILEMKYLVAQIVTSFTIESIRGTVQVKGGITQRPAQETGAGLTLRLIRY